MPQPKVLQILLLLCLAVLLTACDDEPKKEVTAADCEKVCQKSETSNLTEVNKLSLNQTKAASGKSSNPTATPKATTANTSTPSAPAPAVQTPPAAAPQKSEPATAAPAGAVADPVAETNNSAVDADYHCTLTPQTWLITRNLGQNALGHESQQLQIIFNTTQTPPNDSLSMLQNTLDKTVVIFEPLPEYAGKNSWIAKKVRYDNKGTEDELLINQYWRRLRKANSALSAATLTPAQKMVYGPTFKVTFGEPIVWGGFNAETKNETTNGNRFVIQIDLAMHPAMSQVSKICNLTAHAEEMPNQEAVQLQISPLDAKIIAPSLNPQALQGAFKILDILKQIKDKKTKPTN